MKTGTYVIGIVITFASVIAGFYAFAWLFLCLLSGIGGGGSSNSGTGAFTALCLSGVAYLFGIGTTIGGVFQMKKSDDDSYVQSAKAEVREKPFIIPVPPTRPGRKTLEEQLCGVREQI